MRLKEQITNETKEREIRAYDIARAVKGYRTGGAENLLKSLQTKFGRMSQCRHS